MSKQQISCQLSAETVILHTGEGMYYGLNQVGARIWSLIQQPRMVRDIQAALLLEFEVDPEVCLSDIFKLLRDLISKNLVEVRDQASA